MPTLHIDKLRRGERSEDEYKIVETTSLPRWGAGASLTVVGRPQPRVEGVEKVTGRACYANDIYLPGLLCARILRSPLPHARVRRVDTARAEALLGVRAVLSVTNAPQISWYEDSYVFDHTVRFIGDEVAAVAADTEEIAEDALRLIEVEYEALPFVVDLGAALQPNAPQLRESGNLAGEPKIYQRGSTPSSPRSSPRTLAALFSSCSTVRRKTSPSAIATLPASTSASEPSGTASSPPSAPTLSSR
jgi:CO/xanthine dehydrogenase Mo-binding subunit